MRIALIASEWPSENKIGGVAMFNIRLAKQITELGHNLTVFTTSNSQIKDLFNIKTIKIGKNRFSKYYLFPIFISFLLIIKKRSFDKIISSGDDWALIKTSNVVRIFHGSARGEQINSDLIRRLNHKILYLLEKFSSKRIENRFGVGPDSCREFNAKFLAPIFGINTMNCKKTEFPSIVFIGDYSGRKRGWMADQIVNEVRKEFANLKFTVITNPASAKYFQHANDVLSSLTEIEKQTIISKSWVLLSTSVYEGFGIPIFEAMLEGTVPLCSPNPGSQHQLSGATNLIVADNEMDKMLLKCLKDTQLYFELSTLCQKIAFKLQTENLLDKLLESKS